MPTGKVIDLQREREARQEPPKPRATFKQIVELLSRLDDFLKETNHPAGDTLLFGIFNAVLAAFTVAQKTAYSKGR